MLCLLGINVSVPGEVHSEVLSTVHYFQSVSMELVFRLPLEALVVVCTYNLTFLWVELNLP